MTEFRPEQILAVLAEHCVDYVLIGGLAAAIHGSDMVTTDLDITPERSIANLSRLSDALRALHARIRSDAMPDGLPFSPDAASLSKTDIWNLTTDFGDLDIAFIPAGTKGYTDLRRRAIVITVIGTTTTVASLADIIRSKEAADRPKDRIAVPALRRLQDEIDRRGSS
jgi:hypothetical protein